MPLKLECLTSKDEEHRREMVFRARESREREPPRRRSPSTRRNPNIDQQRELAEEVAPNFSSALLATRNHRIVEELQHEYCPPLDSSVFFAICSHFDLQNENKLKRLRSILDSLRKADQEEETEFDRPGNNGTMLGMSPSFNEPNKDQATSVGEGRESSSEVSHSESFWERNSQSSSTTQQSSLRELPYEEKALHQFMEFLTSDPELALLLASAFETLEASRSQANFAKRLREFGKELQKQPSSSTSNPLATQTAGFIRSRSWRVAEMILNWFFKREQDAAQEQASIRNDEGINFKDALQDLELEDNDEKEEDLERNSIKIFDFETARDFISSSPSFSSFKEGLRSRLKTTLDASGTNIKATFAADWEVKLVLEAFGGKPSLGPLLTLSGTVCAAWAATCDQYVCWRWPEYGPGFLQSLDEALRSGWSIKSSDRFQVYVQAKRNDVTVIVEGSRYALLQVAEILAWLCSSVRLSQHAGPAYSHVDVSSWARQSLQGELPKLRLPSLRPVDDTELKHHCWYPMFSHPVIAHGFPCRPRKEGVGLEISFEAMVQLSGVDFLMEYDHGLILKGFSSILVPTQRLLADEGTQWHLITSGDNGGFLSDGAVSEQCSDWIKEDDLNEICTTGARMFLGWCSTSIITLGTRILDASQVEWTKSDGPTNIKKLSGGSLTASLRMPLFGSLAATTNAVLVPNQQENLANRTVKFDELCKAATTQPILVYDQSDRRAWLVPTICILLHMAQSWWAFYNKYQPGYKIPHAEASWDGAKASLDVIVANKDTEIGIPDGKDPYTLELLLKFLFENLHRTREKKSTASTIWACEFMDVVTTPTASMLKKKPFNAVQAPWIGMTKLISPVLICSKLVTQYALPRTVMICATDGKPSLHKRTISVHQSPVSSIVPE